MSRATIFVTVLAAAAACAQPEAAREWPAEHPLRAQARDEAPVDLPSLAPRFDLPAEHDGGAHGGHGTHDAHDAHDEHDEHGHHGGHGEEREVHP